MKAWIAPKNRVHPKIWAMAEAHGLEKGIEHCRKQSEDTLMRASNLWMYAMAIEDVEPEVAERTKKRLEETVIPMWMRYIKPDDITGKGDGDWAIINELQKRGYPYYQPETEM